MSHHASWLRDVVNPQGLRYCAMKLAQEINKDKETLGINSIAVTGLSGSVIGGLVSYMTDLPLILVRKDEKCHSPYDVEYSDNIGTNLNYCIVDDLIQSGKTIRTMVEKINKENGRRNSQLIKVYLYHDNSGEKIEIKDENEDVLFEVLSYAFYGME